MCKRFFPVGGLLAMLVFTSFMLLQPPKPVLYIIGDDTVNFDNSDGEWGWGSVIGDFFDSTQLIIRNQAIAASSTRTFIKEGHWDRVMATLKPGDYVLIQFGHNDGSKPDTTREGYRGVIKGIGDEYIELTWQDGKKEVVYSYGWYIKKFITDTRSKGATPIVASLIPRNIFKYGKVVRSTYDFGKWALEAAGASSAFFIDLNTIIADKYDAMGPEKVKAFFPSDNTHTNKEGALLNAASVVEGLKMIKECSLNMYLLHKN